MSLLFNLGGGTAIISRVPCGPHGYRTSCQAAACACQWAVVLPVLARVPLCHQANPMTAWLLEQGLPWDGTRQKPAARPRFQGPWRPVPGPRTRARWRMALQRRGPLLGRVDLALGSAGGCPGGQQSQPRRACSLRCDSSQPRPAGQPANRTATTRESRPHPPLYCSAAELEGINQ